MKPSTLTNQDCLEVIFWVAFAVQCFSIHEAWDVYPTSKLICTRDDRALLQEDGHGAACQEKQLVASPDIAEACTHISAKGCEEVSERHGIAFDLRGREGRRVNGGGTGRE